MDFITLFFFGAISLIIFSIIITRISKIMIERKALKYEINNAVMNFDKIDELKRKTLPFKYFTQLQIAEQQTIEAKLVLAESIEEKFHLFERVQSLPSKSLQKKVENNIIQTIRTNLRKMEHLPAPDQTGQILKELHVFEKYMKNLTDADVEKKIYALKKKHTIISEAMRVGLQKLAETN